MRGWMEAQFERIIFAHKLELKLGGWMVCWQHERAFPFDLRSIERAQAWPGIADEGAEWWIAPALWLGERVVVLDRYILMICCKVTISRHLTGSR